MMTAISGLALLGCIAMMAVMCVPMALGAVRTRRRRRSATPSNPVVLTKR